MSCLAAELPCVGSTQAQPAFKNSRLRSDNNNTAIHSTSYISISIYVEASSAWRPCQILLRCANFQMTDSRRKQEAPKRALPTYLPIYRKRSKQTGIMLLDIDPEDSVTSQNSSPNTPSSLSAGNISIQEQRSKHIPSASLIAQYLDLRLGLRPRLRLKLHFLKSF